MVGEWRAGDRSDPTDPLSGGIARLGARLPAATRLGRVVLQVAVLERSVEFYRTVLGLEVCSRTDGGAELGVAGEEPLIELRERPGVSPLPRSGRIGLFHFAILLPDRSSLGRFVSHLAEQGIPSGSSDHRVSEAVYLHDPDGLGIEVYADRPREDWVRVGGELLMTSEPLDLGDLRRAAGGERWRGMPAGASIGHIHLHVGDLERAGAFYDQGLGLDRVVWSYPGALFLSAGGYHHHLGVNTWAASATVAAMDDARLLEWWMVVPDGNEVERVRSSLQAGGWQVDVSREGSLLVRDPWGTTLRVLPRGND